MMSSSLEKIILNERATLREALCSIEMSGTRIAIVCDGGRRVIGLLTDGDIRRALLAGAGLDASAEPHATKDFVFVRATASRVDVLELMQARSISEIPILDEANRLCGLHRLRDVVHQRTRSNWAVVMAGGKGRRLGALTASTPKPMLRVAGRPILERIVLHLVGCGFTQIFLAIHHLGHVIEEHFSDGRHLGCRIEYLREKEELGTAGALALLPSSNERPIVVMNGDLVTQADIGSMVDFHERGDQMATVAVRRYVHQVPFGCVVLDGDRIESMEEKPMLSRNINAGVYVLDAEMVKRVPRNQSIGMPSLLSEAMAEGRTVRAFEISEDWIDVGQREQLRAARGEHT
jgi:dTDP-glucose pyrophosphorylase